jgi:hypothetical protein
MKRIVLLLALLAVAAEARIVGVSTYPELYSACQNAEPGDTIIVAKGTYTINDGKSRIMITNRPGPVLVRGKTGDPGDVIIEGLGQDDETVQMIFNLDNTQEWTFESLTTRNSYYHGFKFDRASTNCTLRNIIMRDHGESGVKGTSDPAAGTYPDNLTVEHCDIGFSPGGGGTRSVCEGIDGVGVNYWKIQHNRFVNIQKKVGDGVAYAVFTKGNSSFTEINANRFEDCFIAASFGGGGTDPKFFRDSDQTYEHRHGFIMNNLMIRSLDAGVYINKGTDTRIYHNTLFDCELTIQVRFTESSAEVLNNLIKRSPDNPNEPVIRIRDGATVSWDTANLAASDLDFTGPTGSSDRIDLHLTPGSIAIGKAIGLFAALIDYDGVARPRGTEYDVGAYQFVQAGVNTGANEGFEARYDLENSSLLISLPSQGELTVKLYDALGKEIASLANGSFAEGVYDLALPRHVTSGLYFAAVKFNGSEKMVKVIKF